MGRAPALSRARRLAVALAVAVWSSGCHDLVASGGGGDPVLWRSPTPGLNLWSGTPALDGSRMFAMAGGHLVAVDARNGALLWRRRLTTGAPLATNVVVRRGIAYVADGGAVHALDAVTGAVRWRTAPDDSSASGSENLADDRALYVGTRAHRVHALALDDGRVLWSADVGPGWARLGAVQGIARSGDTLYVAITRRLDHAGLELRGVVVALDRRGGRELWRYQTPGRGGYNAAPVVAGDLLLLGDRDAPAFVALDRRDGRERWRTGTVVGYLGPDAGPVPRGDRAFGAAGDGHAYALRVSDGRVLWRTALAAGASHVALCGGVVLAETQGVSVVEQVRGRLLGTLLEGEDDFTVSGFAVSGRRAYVAGTRALYAFRC